MPQFSTIAQFRALAAPDAPTEAELALIDHSCAGSACILGDGTLPEIPIPDRTIRAALLRLLIMGGTKNCGLHGSGVALAGAYITGTLDLRFSKGRGQIALIACCFERAPQLEQASLDQLALNDSHLPGLFAQGLKVKGSLFLSNLTAKGTVDVNSAKIGGPLECTGANLDGPILEGKKGPALSAHGVKVGAGFFLNNLTARGTVDVNGAKIGRQLTCTGADLDGAEDIALFAQGVEVGADMILCNLTAKGTVALNGARIRGQLDCTGANLDCAGGHALNAQAADVGASLFLTDLTAKGTVDVNGAKIGGQFACDKADLGAGGMALNAQGMRVSQSFIFGGLKSLKGDIYLASAHVGDLVDHLASYPKGEGELYLDGFTYDRISNASTKAQDRLPWLQRGSTIKGTFYPQPYTLLAKVLSEMGHHRDARLVLIARQKRTWQQARTDGRVRVISGPLKWIKRLWCEVQNSVHWSFDWIAYAVAGYGYRPFNAAISLFVLFLAATTLAHITWEEGSFAPNSDVILTSSGWLRAEAADCIPTRAPGCDPNPAMTWSNDPARGLDWDTFNRYGYAADLVIPVLDLGQTDAWAPSKDRGPMGKLLWWGRWVLVALGWVVTALGAAAITGIMQRKTPD
jgi:hypothetical protein